LKKLEMQDSKPNSTILFTKNAQMFNYKIFSVILILLIFFYSCKTKEKSALEKVDETDFCSKVHLPQEGGLTKYFEKYNSQMAESTGAYVLEDGGNALITRAWCTEKADKAIDIQYFIFSFDNVGLIACDYLVKAADRGVKVRIMVDDMMVDAELEDILTLDAHPNIEIKIYNPNVNLGKNIGAKIKNVLTDFKGINQRMHNKTFIVDGFLGITGGRNIADEYFDYDHEYNFRDRDVLLVGNGVKTMSKSFNLFWNNSLAMPVASLKKEKNLYKKAVYDKLHQYACNPENFWPQVRTQLDSFSTNVSSMLASNAFSWTSSFEFVSDLPGKNTNTNLEGSGLSTQALIKLVQNSKKSVDISTPYLITSDIGKRLFAAAVKRGVKVRILTNSLASTDNLEAFSGYQRDRKELLKTGIEIYEFRPDAAERFKTMTGALQKKVNFTPVFGLHAKTMVIDGETAVIGTFNLDPRSANLNTECIAILKDKTIAQGILENMETDYLPENAWKTTATFNPDSKVDLEKRMKVKLRRVVPKAVL
jgi:cardiolipin synthase C